MLTAAQILHLYNLCRDYHLAFTVSTIGANAAAVSHEDLQRLVDLGILSQQDAASLTGSGAFSDAVALSILRQNVEQAGSVG